MLLWLTPIVGLLTVLAIVGVGWLGWRSFFGRSPELARTHGRRGKWLLGLLGLSWALGLGNTILANRPDSPPTMSGHFIMTSILLVGFGLSAAAILRFRKNKWVRRAHMLANSLLVLVALYQIPLGVNRLYKFGLIAPVPQDQAIRSFLQIKFGLQSPPATALAGHAYMWSGAEQAVAHDGTWKTDKDTIVQSDGTSGIVDILGLDGRFPLLVFNEPVMGNFTYSGDFRIKSGKIDQYAGLAFRVVDANNYYVVRASASEQSVSLSRFNNGARQVLRTFPAKVALGEWQNLKIDVVGGKFNIDLNGSSVGELTDDGWLTGRAGLGTKSDSVTRFRNVTATGR